MRILYFISHAAHGGAQRHVRDVACAMQDAGHDVVVVIGESAGWLVNELRMNKIQVVTCSFVRSWNPFAMIVPFFQMRKYVSRTQPDVVHLHGSHALLLVLFLHTRFSTRCVATLHGLSVLAKGASSLIPQSLYCVYLACTLSCMKKIICVAQSDHQLLARQFPWVRSQLVTIRNGIEAPTFLSRTDARARLDLPVDATIIGSLGRFSFAKNFTLLIDAFAQMEDDTVHLCLVGYGEEGEMLRAHAHARGVASRVHIRKGDAAILRAFDVFVLSSRFEGLPYVLIEAALAQVPIVATDVGGVREIIEDQKTGRVVASCDVASLRDAIRESLASRDQSDMYARAALEHAQSQYLFSRMMHQLQSVYRGEEMD